MRNQIQILSSALVCLSSALILLALVADHIGLGRPGFHSLQGFMVAVGGAILFAGITIRNAKGRRRVKSFLMSRSGLAVAASVLTFTFLEGALNVYEWIRHRTPNAMRGLLNPVPDPLLGLRLPPHAEGHDAKGFRNQEVPAKADIVAIGDSQTWGINVPRSQAWPQVLSKLTGRPVYNMGLGYYGPVQYWVLSKEALTLSPKVIVIAFYFGNDLWGAYDMVYNTQSYSEFRKPDPGPDLLQNTIPQKVDDASMRKSDFEKQYADSNYSMLTRKLPQNLALVRLLTRVGIWPGMSTDDKYQMEKAWAAHFPNEGAVYDHGNIRTVFQTGYRLHGLNLAKPAIAEGLRISKEMLQRTKNRTEAGNARLLILFIPTKESVYADAMVRAYGRLNDSFEQIVRNEEQAREELSRQCRIDGIHYVEILPQLKEALRRDVKIYPENSDDHPVVEGYRLFALAVQSALNRLGY